MWHSAELMVWGLCPSSVPYLSQNLLSRFLSNFSCGFPWAIHTPPPPDVFWIFEKKMHFQIFRNFFSFSLIWDPMGAKTSKLYSSIKSLLNLFKLFLNFLPSGLTNVVLKFWVFDFSRIFLVWTWEQKLQHATPPTNHSWIFPDFSWTFFWVVLSKVLFWILKFWVYDL